MAITLIKSGNQSVDLFQTKLKADLDPLIAKEIVQGLILKSISLNQGDNVVNHLLGKTMQGWILVDQTAVSEIYRNAPLNDKTLTLNASAPVQVSLWVF